MFNGHCMGGNLFNYTLNIVYFLQRSALYVLNRLASIAIIALRACTLVYDQRGVYSALFLSFVCPITISDISLASNDKCDARGLSTELRWEWRRGSMACIGLP